MGMDGSAGAAGSIGLDDVLITEQLALRPATAASSELGPESLKRIAARMSHGRAAVMQEVCEIALDVCRAGSAGISVLETPASKHFVWEALAGEFAPYQGGTAPRHHSPCGVALDKGTTVLFDRPQRFFSWLNGPGIPIVEGLVVPLYVRQVPFASIWVMKHTADSGFTAFEAHTMHVLGGHACAAISLSR